MQSALTRMPLIVVAALFALVASIMPAAAQTPLNALDLDGDTNVARAIAWSTVTYTPPGETPANPPSSALIGRSDNFADNLAAGSLMGAAAANGVPLFLTGSQQLDPDVLAELERILPAGSPVTILGGEVAVDPAVGSALESAGFEVNRLAGETRTETAIDIAQESTSDTVLIVRSTGSSADPTQAFADSLAAGALAATNGWEILFTQTSSLNPNTAAELESAGYSTAYVVGGPAAISADTFDAVGEIVTDTQRVAGDTRFDTAVMLNELRTGTVGDITIVVDGQSADAWADGFPAANLSGTSNYPVVLTNGSNVPDETATYLAARGSADSTFAQHLDGVGLICGPTATDSACADALEDLNGNTDGTISTFPPVVEPIENNPVFTDAPELLNVVQDGDVVDDEATFRFTFDESLDADSLNASCFHLYRFDQVTMTNDDGADTDCAGDNGGHSDDANVNDASNDGRTAELDADDDSVVVVTFPVEAAELPLVTLATVDWAAALDSDGTENLEGTYAFDDVSIPGGTTFGPALTSVEDVDLVTDSADFVFDVDVNGTLTNANGFSLILENGDVLVSDAAEASDTDANTVVAEFNNPANDELADPAAADAGTLTEDTVVARAAAAAESVTDADESYANDLSVVSSGDGITEDPDLVGVEPGAEADTLAFDFDVEIEEGTTSPCAVGELPVNLTPTSAACFLVENVNGTDVAATEVAIDETDASIVVATFADGELDAAVAAFVLDGAVTDTSGDTPRDSDVARYALADVTADAGMTLGPDLTGVADSTDTAGDRSLAFTFDSDVVADEGTPLPGDEAGPDASRFFAYDADGVPTRGVAAVIDGNNANVVLVTFGDNTDEVLDAAVTATVNDGAVADADGQTNPEGAGADLSS